MGSIEGVIRSNLPYLLPDPRSRRFGTRDPSTWSRRNYGFRRLGNETSESIFTSFQLPSTNIHPRSNATPTQRNPHG